MGVAGLLLSRTLLGAQWQSGSLQVQWNPGAADCAVNPEPPLQVHRYNENTYILRESLCATPEAPFLYLLIGTHRAMLIDTGDVADAAQMPLAASVMRLLPEAAGSRLPLLVVHTHRHLDHRAADSQFAALPGVQVVPYDLPGVQRFYGFTRWPVGSAQLDLGERTVDVLPTPGHNATHVCFYDRQTGLLFSGDALMPARLLIDDTAAARDSALRLAQFVRQHPVSYVLGGHIEQDSHDQTFEWGSHYHPDEHVLQLTQADVFELPATLQAFNGLYTRHGHYVVMNSMRMLWLSALAALLVLAALVLLVVRWLRRRRLPRRSPA